MEAEEEKQKEEEAVDENTQQKRQKIQAKQKLERGRKLDELRASKIRVHSSAAEGVRVCQQEHIPSSGGLNFSNRE